MKRSFHPTAFFLVKPPSRIREYERLFLWRTLFSLFLVSRCSLLNLFHLDIQYKKKKKKKTNYYFERREARPEESL